MSNVREFNKSFVTNPKRGCGYARIPSTKKKKLKTLMQYLLNVVCKQTDVRDIMPRIHLISFVDRIPHYTEVMMRISTF